MGRSSPMEPSVISRGLGGASLRRPGARSLAPSRPKPTPWCAPAAAAAHATGQLALLASALAGLAPWLRARSYLAYTAGMTPLVILLLNAGRPIAADVLVERVVATLLGAGLVIAANRPAPPP